MGVELRKFGHEMTEKLIECVKKHPFLYDPKDDGYKNVAMKTRVWKQIGKDIKESGETAKIKWKSLRDNYGRYKKEMADPKIKVKKFIRWPWCQHLQFLDSTFTEREKLTRKRSHSGSTTPPPPQFLEISMSEPEVDRQEWTEQPSVVVDTNFCSNSPPVSPSVEDTEEYPFLQKRLKTDSSTQERQDLDAVGHLFQSYAHTFKTFSRKNQIALKVELAQLFADIEAKEMMERMSAGALL